MYKLKSEIENENKSDLLQEIETLREAVANWDLSNEDEINSISSTCETLYTHVISLCGAINLLSTINNKEDRELFFEEVSDENNSNNG